MEKTISYLKTQPWYRFFKVVYITAFILIMIFVNFIGFEEGLKFALIANAIIISLFFFIRGSFYYVVIGQFNPKI